MDGSLIQMYTFVLVLVVSLAGVAFMLSRRPEHKQGNTLLESAIWAGSLIACAGGDYLVVMVHSNQVWS